MIGKLKIALPLIAMLLFWAWLLGRAFVDFVLPLF